MTGRRVALVLAFGLAWGCERPGEAGPVPDDAPAVQSAPAPSGPLQGGTDDWRQVASADDRARLAGISAAWRQALQEAAQAGFNPKVEEAGPALDPDAGLTGRVQPTPGDYACSIYKVGHQKGVEGVGFVTYPPFRCTVELTSGGDLILSKTTGSQRTRGLIYPDDERRGVFIGAQAWGLEESYPGYGEQPARDQIGVVERIGDNVWRIAFPFPHQESRLDVLVLTR